MRLSVLVPTYRRPADLSRCLSALAAQTRVPDEIIIVTHSEDIDTLALLARQQEILPLRTVTVDRSGVVAKLNRGLSVCQGDIVAITDDDAAPRPDWLARIEAHFRDDARIGAAGGRDFVHQDR